jgi:DNA-binding GntR family transcriptional regulator
MAEISKRTTPRKPAPSKTKGSSAQSLARTVYDHLVDRILGGGLPPGSLIKRRDIARELKASVAPVLEAMVRLETEGFLETHPRKGTQVRPITREDVRGGLILRAALECEAARWYAGEPLRAQAGPLSELAAAAERTGADAMERWRADLEFHRALVDCAQCPALSDAFRRSSTLWWFYAIHQSLGGRILPGQTHLELLKKLQSAKDGLAAARELRAHIRSGKEALWPEGASGSDGA